jgi:hypothetical protein
MNLKGKKIVNEEVVLPNCKRCKWVEGSVLSVLGSNMRCGAIGYKNTEEVYDTASCKGLYAPRAEKGELDE